MEVRRSNTPFEKYQFILPQNGKHYLQGG